MDSTTSIMWGVLFGSIGMGYLIYGKKQQRGIALLSGVILCAFPYFVPNVYLMILIGIVVMALPYFLRY
jgi:choline-glycine betaine transporter